MGATKQILRSRESTHVHLKKIAGIAKHDACKQTKIKPGTTDITT
jgi:hypothetical protein